MKTTKLVPETIGIRNGQYVPQAPVTSIRIYPQGEAPKHSPIRRDLTTIEIRTDIGSRWFGAKRAWITDGLRVAIELCDGAERDEVLAKWADAV